MGRNQDNKQPDNDGSNGDMRGQRLRSGREHEMKSDKRKAGALKYLNQEFRVRWERVKVHELDDSLESCELTTISREHRTTVRKTGIRP